MVGSYTSVRLKLSDGDIRDMGEVCKDMRNPIVAY
jgi:hypothetical protein